MPFQPGNKHAVGKGRPRKDPHLQELARFETEACVQTLAGMVVSAKEKSSNRLQAAKILLEFGWGKPKQAIDLNAKGDLTVQFLDALKTINEKIIDDAPPMIETTAEEAPRGPSGDLAGAIKEADTEHKREQPNWAKSTAELVDVK